MSTTSSVESTPTSPRSVVPDESPNRNERDVNAIVERATEKFNEMDAQIKALIEDLKSQSVAMAHLNEIRYKTAKHVESLVENTPLSTYVSPAIVANTGVANDSDEQEEAEEMKVVELDSFVAVHQSVYDWSKKFTDQYDTYLVKYLVDWEHVVSTRVNGLLIHYKELHQNALHYQKKVGGLHGKVDKTKSVRRALAEKLDRNEIKEMGAIEARDTVGEHIFLLIDEVTQRVWRDIFPLLLRACRFEADFSAQQASLFSQLNDIAVKLEAIGDDYGCEKLGRLDDIEKKHPEEIYTIENPFVKLRPLKMPHVEEEASPEGNESFDSEAAQVEDEAADDVNAEESAGGEGDKVEEGSAASMPEDEKAMGREEV